MKNIVGKRLRELRLKRNLSQENIAEELDITHSAYSKIERGETEPNVSRLFELAKILQVSVHEILGEPVPSLEEKKGNYGFATKDEVENLSSLVQKLLKEFELLRSELKAPKTPTKIKQSRK